MYSINDLHKSVQSFQMASIVANNANVAMIAACSNNVYPLSNVTYSNNQRLVTVAADIDLIINSALLASDSNDFIHRLYSNLRSNATLL